MRLAAQLAGGGGAWLVQAAMEFGLPFGGSVVLAGLLVTLLGLAVLRARRAPRPAPPRAVRSSRVRVFLSSATTRALRTRTPYAEVVEKEKEMAVQPGN